VSWPLITGGSRRRELTGERRSDLIFFRLFHWLVWLQFVRLVQSLYFVVWGWVAGDTMEIDDHFMSYFYFYLPINAKRGLYEWENGTHKLFPLAHPFALASLVRRVLWIFWMGKLVWGHDGQMTGAVFLHVGLLPQVFPSMVVGPWEQSGQVMTQF